MNDWTIADVIATAGDRLARLTSADYTIQFWIYSSTLPCITVQVGHWLPSDDRRVEVIHEVCGAISDTATWVEEIRATTYLHASSTIDGVEWRVWAVLKEPGRAQAEAARIAAAEAGAA